MFQMSTLESTTTLAPAGTTWAADTVHSNVTLAVEYARATHDQGRHEAGRAEGPPRCGTQRRSVRPRAPRAHARDRDRPHRVRRRMERAESERRQLPRRRRHPEGRPDLREAGQLTMRIL